MAKKGLLERAVENVMWRLFISIVYITGLTLLIPFVFLFVFPESMDVVSPALSQALVWAAVCMVVVSFVVTVRYRKSVGVALKSLGRVTFIPGLIGIVFSMFGRDIILLYMAARIPAFEQVRELVELYLDNAVPKVRVLTFGFFILGTVLWLLGDKMMSRR